MRAKRDLQFKAVALRSQGLSYNQIRRQLHVSKGSVSLWCRQVALDSTQRQELLQRKLIAAQQGLARIAALRQAGLLKRRSLSDKDKVLKTAEEAQHIKQLYETERLSFSETATRLGTSRWRVYRLMRLHGIPRRHGSEQNYATYKTKPQFAPKQDLTIAEEQLRIAGAMLYWAEGSKNRTTVDLANSDPRLIALFVTFLRNICGVAEERLRVHLYAYADQDIESLKAFWSEVTGIASQQFIKPYVRALTPNLSHRKMTWGLVHITYSDGRLLALILRWAKEFSNIWAGARVVKWSCL